MRNKYKTLLISICLIFIVAGCAEREEREFYSQLDNKIAHIRIESSWGDFEIKNGDSISKVVAWLKQSEPINTNYASYPSAEMKLIFSTVENTQFIIYASYPNHANIPVMIKYKSIDFVAPSHPVIPAFEFFREKTNPSNLIPNKK